MLATSARAPGAGLASGEAEAATGWCARAGSDCGEKAETGAAAALGTNGDSASQIASNSESCFELGLGLGLGFGLGFGFDFGPAWGMV